MASSRKKGSFAGVRLSGDRELRLFIEEISSKRVQADIKRDISQRMAEEVAREARRIAPSRTNKLKDSIEVVRRRGGYEVVAKAPYARAVEEGRVGFKIRGGLGAQIEITPGKFVWAHQVKAAKAVPFLKPAYNRVLRRWKETAEGRRNVYKVLRKQKAFRGLRLAMERTRRRVRSKKPSED